jgi:hypothetical protein
MAATYDSNLPTPKDRMRHSLGDTDVTAPLRGDETYTALLAAYSETEATAVLAEALAAEYAQLPASFGAGGTTFSWSDRVKTWLALAARLRTALAETAGTVSNQLHTIQPRRGDWWGRGWDGDEERSEYVRPIWWSP